MTRKGVGRPNRIFRAAIGALLSVAFLPPAFAQKPESRPSEETEISPIVVTATKQATLRENIAASVTVITRQDMESQSATTVTEVLRNLAGVDLVSLGTLGDDQDVRIRGADRDEVLVLLDGIPINNLREDRASFLGIIPLEIVEKIEVVRGSQSVLYGSDAVGGVVNIITRPGSPGRQLTLGFEGGNLGTFREFLGASGASDKISYSTALSRVDQEGRFPRDAFGAYTLHGNFTYRPSSKLSFNFGTDYFHANQEIFYEFLNSFDPATGNVLVRIDPDNNSDLKREILVSRADVKATPLSWWNMEVLYGFFLDHDSTRNSAIGDTVPDGFVPGEQDFKGRGDRHFVDLRNFFREYESENFSAHLTVGFEFKHEKFGFSDPISMLVFPDVGQDDTRNNYAPYFMQRFKFLKDALIVSAGARYDRNTTFGNEWSPQASILYKLNKTGTSVHFSYGEGFHAPTILEFFTAVLQQQLNLPFIAARLQAELSQSYEAGVEQKLGKWGRIGATFYYLDYDRLFDELQFVNDAYTTGVEVGLDLKPHEKVRMGGNYTYLKSKNEDTGDELSNRPRHRLNAFVEGMPIEPLQLRLDLNFVGDRLIPNFLSTDAGDVPFIFIDPNGIPQGGSLANALTNQGRTLSGYVKLDFSASYRIAERRWGFQNWRVYGKIENLLDESYQEKFGFPAPGITFLLGTQAVF